MSDGAEKDGAGDEEEEENGNDNAQEEEKKDEKDGERKDLWLITLHTEFNEKLGRKLNELVHKG